MDPVRFRPIGNQTETSQIVAFELVPGQGVVEIHVDPGLNRLCNDLFQRILHPLWPTKCWMHGGSTAHCRS